MKVKALVGFSGAFSMYVGEVREISDKAILSDLLQAKYIEEVKTEISAKDVKNNASKRDSTAKRG